jgi:hypothetical protein
MYEDESDYELRSFCAQRPNLQIDFVSYDHIRESLQVTVINNAFDPLEGRDVSLQITLADGSTLIDRPLSFPHTTVESSWPPVTFEIPGIGAEQRARMFDGYTVTIDPLDSIAEKDEGDNDYVVPPGARLAFSWFFIQTYPYQSLDQSEWIVNMHISAKSIDPSIPTSFRHLVGARGLIEWAEETQTSSNSDGQRYISHQTEFEIYGDEALLVHVDGEMKLDLGVNWRDLGSGLQIRFPYENWGAGEESNQSTIYIHPPDDRYRDDPDWYVVYSVEIISADE